MRVLGNYCRLGEVRTHIRVGVVGKATQIRKEGKGLGFCGVSLGKKGGVQEWFCNLQFG